GERPQVRVRRRRSRGIEERDDVVLCELLAHDRPALEHSPLARAEAVEARREQRLHGLGQRALAEASLQRQREQLLEEERGALGRRSDPRALVGLESGAAEPVEKRVSLLGGERIEDDARGIRESLEELGPLLEELLARDAHDDDRLLALVGEVLDELEERRL